MKLMTIDRIIYLISCINFASSRRFSPENGLVDWLLKAAENNSLLQDKINQTTPSIDQDGTHDHLTNLPTDTNEGDVTTSASAGPNQTKEDMTTFMPDVEEHTTGKFKHIPLFSQTFSNFFYNIKDVLT